jgi:hypothetical protein
MPRDDFVGGGGGPDGEWDGAEPGTPSGRRTTTRTGRGRKAVLREIPDFAGQVIVVLAL